jgi:hypothetical protein
MRIGLGGVGALALALALGCGGGDEAPVAQQRSMGQPRPEQGAAEDEANRPPVVERVEITPQLPTPQDTIVVVARASDPDGDPVTLRYVWTVNGRPAGNDEKLAPGTASRDDVVAVSVVAEDTSFSSEAMTDEVTVVGATPHVRDITFEPMEPTPGETVTALVDVDNSEDDSRLEFTYRWMVNGNPTGAVDKAFSTQGLRRGDRVAVEVIASDGEMASQPTRSGNLVLGNSPPKIKGIPAAVQDGDAFTYQFEAEDADGDASLRFSLGKAPAGMTIDPIYGLATWRPTADQVGDQPIEVVVKDSTGASGTLRFSVAVNATAPQAAAPDGKAAAPSQKEAPPAKAAELRFSDEPDPEEAAE